jgi:two-component system, chemotaxis family, CheB/CheR fusion protein
MREQFPGFVRSPRCPQRNILACVRLKDATSGKVAGEPWSGARSVRQSDTAQDRDRASYWRPLVIMTRRRSRPTRTRKPSTRTARPAARGPEIQPTGESPRDQAPPRHIVVGVGASAGGLEAFTLLLQHLPTDAGMAFVLVQHLDPARESALSDILSRATSLPVREVGDEQPIKPDHIYVIPPNANLAIAGGVVRPEPRQSTGPHRSIDSFFESLAQDQRERAIGVILSGTATDGTLGLEAIKAEGGITFAQDDSAKYDSMPRSAIAAACVDFVLKPEDIANELARIAKHPFVAGEPTQRFASAEDDRASATAHEDDGAPLPSGGHGKPRTEAKQAREEADAARGRASDNGYKRVLLLLCNHCGVDFSLYKSTTIQRRIARRMVLNKQESLEDYAQFLRSNAKELDALYSDVLISVTSFFRNPEAFDVLKRKVFTKLLQQRGDEPLRVWTLGCSTGQEAYSIAMAFVESSEKAPRMRKLQVFATDLNDALLDKARHGLYAKSLVQDVSPDRLRRFFVEEEGGYRVVKSLREMVVFARQNFISDPPFSRMDLVSCRNLLIYLEPSLQQKLFPSFDYALKPDGFLFLGASESLGTFTDLFDSVDKKNKSYSKKAASTPAFQLPLRKERGEYTAVAKVREAAAGRTDKRGQGESPGFRAELSSQREADRVTINKYSPPSVLVNGKLQILQFRGPTSAYLEPPTGKATFDVLKMARQGLMLPLRAAINKAKKDNKTARRENVQVDQNGSARVVNVEVIPLKNLRERCFLILFEDAEKATRISGALVPGRHRGPAKTPHPVRLKEDSGRIAKLERELAETRDYLQSVLEQHDAANEELQASNEEVQSANEELQSINEELETSKEELESSNEELSTVNEEMATRNIELNRLNSDLVNLQTSTKLAILLLGRDLTIRRFSKQAEKQFNLLAADIGRPLSRIRHNLDLADLEPLVEDVIASIRVQEREVRDQGGRWFSLRVRPYLTVDNKVDGAVLVLVSIDEQKRVEQAIADGRDYAEAVIRTMPDPLILLTADLNVQSANDAFYRTFRLSKTEAVGRSLFELGHGSWNIPELRDRLDDILRRNDFFNDFEVAPNFAAIGQRTVVLNARTLLQDEGKTKLILLGIRDVTERNQAEEAVRECEERYGTLVAPVKDYAIFSTDLAGRATSWNEGVRRILRFEREEFISRDIVAAIFTPDDIRTGVADRELEEAAAEGSASDDRWLQRRDGARFFAQGITTALKDGSGVVVGFTKIFRDTTEQKEAEEALHQAHANLQTHSEELARFNRVAVGRETRMIELKKEINELCERHGEPAPYPLEFEREGGDAND